MEKMDRPDELVAPNCWINHNKDICHIKNYYADREHTELILFRQEMQIETGASTVSRVTSAKSISNILKSTKKRVLDTQREG